MALVLPDRVKETATTAGTGTFTLAGAVEKFQSFSAVGDGNTTYYCIQHETENEFEVGLGTYTASGTTLSRDTILTSTNSNNAVDFSAGDKTVFVVVPGDKTIRKDGSGAANITSSDVTTALGFTPISSADGGNAATLDSLDSTSFLRSDADDTATGTMAFSGFLSNTGGSKLEIQNATDGGGSHGIYVWDSTDTNWVIYMSQSGSGKSSAGGTACAGLDGRTAHAIRYRVNDSDTQGGHIFENASEECLFQIQPDTGNAYVRGSVKSQVGYTNTVGVDTNKQWGLSFSTADPGDANGYNLLRESGAWTSPYPDIRMNAHTGFNMRANASYDGVRIFRDYNDNNRIIQFNGPSNYIYKDVWMNITTEAIYSSTNSMHLYPNSTSSYASLAVSGSKGSYGGLYDAYSAVHFMHDSSGNGGNYREANGRWYFYHNVSNNCTGFSASTTSSSYTIYSTGAIYSTGNITAYSDARMKENIVTIDNALDKVSAMRGVYYNKIDDETKTRQVGVIAQEMLEPEACPEAVTYAEDVDEYGVSYGNLVGVLIEAVKELRQEVAELRSN